MRQKTIISVSKWLVNNCWEVNQGKTYWMLLEIFHILFAGMEEEWEYKRHCSHLETPSPAHEEYIVNKETNDQIHCKKQLKIHFTLEK